MLTICAPRTAQALSARRALSRCLLALSLIATGSPVMAIEEPAYEVTRSDGANELRRYRSFIVAETVVEGDLDTASSQGFRRIAGYIFGGNRSVRAEAGSSTSASERIAMTAPVTIEPAQASAQPGSASEKIAMTAPVTVQPQGDGGDAALSSARQWRVHFVMPARYTLATLPRPLDPQVTLREVPGGLVAVRRFSGFAGQQKAQRETEALQAWLQAQGLRPSSGPQLARYDPPWTLPFMRRNEVMIPIVSQP